MSDAPDKESQTEEATEKRLHDSIEKGDTPHSREVTLFASLLASLLFCSFFFRAGAARLVGALQHLLDQSALFDLGAGRNASVLMRGRHGGGGRLPAARFRAVHHGLAARLLRPELPRALFWSA